MLQLLSGMNCNLSEVDLNLEAFNSVTTFMMSDKNLRI